MLKRSLISSMYVTIIIYPMHRFADTFDDVSDTAVATGAIGSSADSLALSGGVDV